MTFFITPFIHSFPSQSLPFLSFPSRITIHHTRDHITYHVLRTWGTRLLTCRPSLLPSLLFSIQAASALRHLAARGSTPRARARARAPRGARARALVARCVPVRVGWPPGAAAPLQTHAQVHVQPQAQAQRLPPSGPHHAALALVEGYVHGDALTPPRRTGRPPGVQGSSSSGPHRRNADSDTPAPPNPSTHATM